METNSTSKKPEEVVVSKDINKETNNVPEAKSLTNDVIIKQELPDALPGPKEPLQEVKALESTNQIKEEVAMITNVSTAAVGITGKVHQSKSEVKVEKDREGKSRSDRAKVKHKKKHKHKHDKGKEERSRDRHKAVRRRKPSEKSKASDAEGKEKSAMDVGQWISYGEFSPKNLYYRMGPKMAGSRSSMGRTLYLWLFLPYVQLFVSSWQFVYTLHKSNCRAKLYSAQHV